MKEQLTEIKNAFGIKGEIVSFTRVGNGNVNDTYCVIIKNAGQRKYVFQRLNTEAFENPDIVMENAVRASSILREKHVFEKVINYYKLQGNNPEANGEEHESNRCFQKNRISDLNDSCDKKLCNQEECCYTPRYLYIKDKKYWRVFDYIVSVTYNKTADYCIVEEAGKAFGCFIKSLAGRNFDEFKSTIEGFHNTKRRYESLYKALKLDVVGRSVEVQKEVAWLRSVEKKACMLTEIQLQGEIPVRITHNDTKTNNVLFDKIQKKAITVIDLDTVMPGLVAHDFGDGVRYASGNFMEPDGKEKTVFCFDLFQAYAQGFISSVKSILSKKELETLYMGPFTMAVELATRYLEDYLSGDRYFNISNPQQNLVKARQQILLAKQIQSSEYLIREYIWEILKAEVMLPL